MTTFTTLTTVDGKEAAYALSEAMERMDPEPLGVGVFELEDGSGNVIGYDHTFKKGFWNWGRNFNFSLKVNF